MEKRKEIVITTGVGVAPTKLAAFDAALREAGIGNYNLIPLSSVIPPDSDICIRQHIEPQEEYGDRLYVVIAEARATEVGKSAWAGLGWAQNAQSGHGLFVEICGDSQEAVETEIRLTLEDMIKNRPQLEYGPICSKVAGIECHGKPVCVLVAAIYKSERW